ncbi:MAG: hypothetical protein V4608_15895 [Bacteroidota bacterium]
MAILTNILHRWTLPPERNFGWKMKPLESAITNFTIDKDGVFILTIEHDPICGVTPKMLLWWFQNIGGEMTYEGKTYPKYLVWHPKDHIHWNLINNSSNSEIGPGSHFRIVEALDRNMNFLIDSIEIVEKLDETGIRLIRKIGSIEVFSLQHDFIQNGSNTIYKSKMIVGTNKAIGKVFNSFVRPLIFSKEMGAAWLKHNIEEVGNFEFFLPELYDLESRNPQIQ